MKLLSLQNGLKEITIVEDADDKFGALRRQFTYTNYNLDPEPDILYLGKWTNPITNSTVVGGLNLNYMTSNEVGELKNAFPRIMRGRNLRDRYRIGRVLLPKTFHQFYRTYNPNYIEKSGVNTFKDYSSTEQETPDNSQNDQSIGSSNKSEIVKKLLAKIPDTVKDKETGGTGKVSDDTKTINKNGSIEPQRPLQPTPVLDVKKPVKQPEPIDEPIDKVSNYLTKKAADLKKGQDKAREIAQRRKTNKPEVPEVPENDLPELPLPETPAPISNTREEPTEPPANISWRAAQRLEKERVKNNKKLQREWYKKEHASSRILTNPRFSKAAAICESRGKRLMAVLNRNTGEVIVDYVIDHSVILEKVGWSYNNVIRAWKANGQIVVSGGVSNYNFPSFVVDALLQRPGVIVSADELDIK